MREPIQASRQATLRDFAAVVFRRKWAILVVLLAALATILVIDARTPPSYASTARLLINRGEFESPYSLRTRVLSWDEEINSELEVLQSVTLGERAQKILRDTGAVDGEGRPIEFRAGAVRAQSEGKANVLVVTYTSSDPTSAQEALRALVRAYFEWRTEQRSLPAVEAFLQEELETLRDRLDEWEQRRADFMSEEGIVFLTTDRDVLMRQREGLMRDLAGARASAVDYAARLEVIRGLQEEKRSNPELAIYGLGDSEFNDDTILESIRRELTQRRTEYYSRLSRYQPDHPEVRAIKDLIAHLERQLDNETESYTRFLAARVDVVQARIASLEATIQGIEEELSGFPDKTARLAQYDRVIQALETDYRVVVDRQVAAKIENTGRPETREVLLQPSSQAERERTRDYVRLALVPLFAVLIGLALAFVLDGLDHSVKDASEAEEHLNIPVLGSIGKLR